MRPCLPPSEVVGRWVGCAWATEGRALNLQSPHPRLLRARPECTTRAGPSGQHLGVVAGEIDGIPVKHQLAGKLNTAQKHAPHSRTCKGQGTPKLACIGWPPPAASLAGTPPDNYACTACKAKQPGTRTPRGHRKRHARAQNCSMHTLQISDQRAFAPTERPAKVYLSASRVCSVAGCKPTKPARASPRPGARTQAHAHKHMQPSTQADAHGHTHTCSFPPLSMPNPPPLDNAEQRTHHSSRARGNCRRTKAGSHEYWQGLCGWDVKCTWLPQSSRVCCPPSQGQCSRTHLGTACRSHGHTWPLGGHCQAHRI